jgi:cell division septum initiation protein DivIVA
MANATTAAPTKQEELAILQFAADQLEGSSYLGQWLRETIPFLRQSLASDWIPESAVRMQDQGARFRQEALLEAKAIREEAQAQADRIRKEAEATAERMVKAAQDERDRAWNAVRAALRRLED